MDMDPRNGGDDPATGPPPPKRARRLIEEEERGDESEAAIDAVVVEEEKKSHEGDDEKERMDGSDAAKSGGGGGGAPAAIDMNVADDDDDDDDDDETDDGTEDADEGPYAESDVEGEDDNEGGFACVGIPDDDEDEVILPDDIDPAFILRPPVNDAEVAETERAARRSVESAFAVIEEHGYEHYRQTVLAAQEAEADADDDAEAEQSMQDAIVRGAPRKYQTALFELAKRRNTIVNLGTGQGKTLVALLCIKHFASPAFEENPPKQTIFLVPSVALAVQHTTTLRANLPYTVATACHTATNSDKARDELSKANIVVATHGAARDLLFHYADLFSLDRCNLLVVDECHYATGEHGYARILKRFYHRLPPQKRPRVLGLTASPLVNVKNNVTDDKLEQMLDGLESILDAKLASFSADLSDADADSKGSGAASSGLVHQAAEERVQFYKNDPPLASLPPHDNIGLHPSRIREFNQLHDLYADLGPKCTSIYCRTLSREVSRNRYEEETPSQFSRVVSHLKLISQYCADLCLQSRDGGRSDKLVVLESLLEDIVEGGGAGARHGDEGGASSSPSSSSGDGDGGDGDDKVGVVFVERRITALALYDYFRSRRRALEEGTWTRVDRVASQSRNREPVRDERGEARRRGQVDTIVDRLMTDFEEAYERRVGAAAADAATAAAVDCGDADVDDVLETEFDPASFAMEAIRDVVVDAVREGAARDDDYVELAKAVLPAVDPSERGEGCISATTAGRRNSAEEGWLPNCPIGTESKNCDRNKSDDTSPQDGSAAAKGPCPSATEEKSQEVLPPTESKTHIESEKKDKYVIRADMIVRHTTQVFKYLDKRNKLSTEDQERAKEAWLHQMKKIRDVLDGLRRKKTNVLIATSVVEEGVDVDACSFVVVFDNLRSSKGYVQMKGRARQRNAKFFVFQDSHPLASKPSMTLEAAQEVEQRIRYFIMSRQSNVPEEFPIDNIRMYSGPSLQSEEVALKEGEYRSENGSVDLSSAKSLLNRYTLSIPMDATARARRESMLLLMPIFDENRLILPAHLPAEVRSVCLPQQYHHRQRKEKHNMLALMACVRLHSLNLLNDRLLPLRRRDMQKKLMGVALSILPESGAPATFENEIAPSAVNDVFIYPLCYSGAVFLSVDQVLKGRGRMLALVTLKPLPVEIQPVQVEHAEFGEISCAVRPQQSATLTSKEWDKCALFFESVMNSRWRKRSGNKWYRYCPEKAKSDVRPPYVVCCLTAEGTFDWERMQRIVSDVSRSEVERRDAVRAHDGEGDMPEPRLWSPVYDPFTIYIAYGPSGLTCDSRFPFQKDDITTYEDYLKNEHQFSVGPKCKLFCAQRLWNLPRRSRRERDDERIRLLPSVGEPGASETEKVAELEPQEFVLQEGERAPCEGLDTVLLAQDSCMEVPLSDSSLFLHCLILPQVLYQVDRVLTARSLIDWCHSRLPTLGTYLEKLSLVEDLLEALTAKSCSLGLSYDKLEWLGDAVLKLLQTDALLHSRDLRQWVAYLHEGDLSTLRSAMGSNDRLKDVAQSVGLDRFILIHQLGRGQWTPVGFSIVHLEDNDAAKATVVEERRPSPKACADVVESILGLVFVHFGYEAAVKVGEELNVSLPTDPDIEWVTSKVTPKKHLISLGELFLGKNDFKRPQLLEEALTHPSCIHEEVPCYQKLEWVGDAVLCLAAREWVYKTYTNLLVSEQVIVESTLVCNEILGYLSIKKGLQRFINHRDSSLPARLEEFERNLFSLGRGLWGTEPPKVLSDAVESMLGAAFVDGGYKDGVRATKYVLKPIIDTIMAALQSDDTLKLRKNARGLMHPKQFMHELAGGIFQIRAFSEEEFASRRAGASIWKDGEWKVASLNSNGGVGTIQCCGIHLIAAGESSSEVARNRACGLAVGFLSKSPDLVEQLQSLFLKLKPKKDEDNGDKEPNANL